MEKCEKCLYYKNKEKCGECGRLSNVMDNYPMFAPNTNYDRIKSMSVEELISVILMLSERVKKYPNARITLVKQWLLQEVSEDE